MYKPTQAQGHNKIRAKQARQLSREEWQLGQHETSEPEGGKSGMFTERRLG